MLKNVEVIVITVTKPDDTFPTSQFLVNGFPVPWRLNLNKNGLQVMIYICYDMPSKRLVKQVLPSDIERLFTELNFRKARWLLFRTYHAQSQSDPYCCNNLGEVFDTNMRYCLTFLLFPHPTPLKFLLIHCIVIFYCFWSFHTLNQWLKWIPDMPSQVVFFHPYTSLTTYQSPSSHSPAKIYPADITFGMQRSMRCHKLSVPSV